MKKETKQLLERMERCSMLPYRLIVKEPKDLEIVKDEFGNYYFTLKEKAQLVHEEQEHKTIEIMPGTYKQYSEREFDYFAKAVINSRD